jgi:Tol biopolymer transport system component
MNADGTAQTRLTRQTLAALFYATPAWSPDAQRIAFASNRDARNSLTFTADIYTMQADGTGVTRLTTTDPAIDSQPGW